MRTIQFVAITLATATMTLLSAVVLMLLVGVPVPLPLSQEQTDTIYGYGDGGTAEYISSVWQIGQNVQFRLDEVITVTHHTNGRAMVTRRIVPILRWDITKTIRQQRTEERIDFLLRPDPARRA